MSVQLGSSSRLVSAPPASLVRGWVLAWIGLLAIPAVAQDSVAEGIRRQKLEGARIGVHVVRLEDATERLSYGAEIPLVPASNQKLVTAAVALEVLGRGYEHVTELRLSAAGDLLLIGSGDPNISGRFHDDDKTAVLKGWAEALASAGVTSIPGALILDDRAFDPPGRHPAWPPEQAWEWYCAVPSALSYNDNCVEVTTAPAPGGTSVTFSPLQGPFDLRVSARTTRKKSSHRIVYHRIAGSWQVRVSGKVWDRAAPFTASVTAPDPAVYFGAVLRRVLADRGIAVAGPTRRAEPGETWPESTLVAVHRSPLPRTLEVMDRRSQNLYAENVLWTIGRHAAGRGGWATGSREAERFLESEVGLSPTEVVVSDGSGLSRDNRISARAMTAMLCWMIDRETFPTYLDSLPRGGEAGTSLRSRLGDLGPRVRAKTGRLSDVSCLSGYILDDAGRPTHVFAVLVNGTRKGTRPASLFADDLVREVCGGT